MGKRKDEKIAIYATEEVYHVGRRAVNATSRRRMINNDYNNDDGKIVPSIVRVRRPRPYRFILISYR